jgi:hypothetical protein
MFSALGTASVWNLDEYAEGVREFQTDALLGFVLVDNVIGGAVGNSGDC